MVSVNKALSFFWCFLLSTLLVVAGTAGDGDELKGSTSSSVSSLMDAASVLGSFAGVKSNNNNSNSGGVETYDDDAEALLFPPQQQPKAAGNFKDPLMHNGHPSASQRAQFKEERRRRMKEQRERARAKLAAMSEDIRPELSHMEQMSPQELDELREDIAANEKEDHVFVRRGRSDKAEGAGRRRRMGWLSGGSESATATLADPSQYYDKWQQGYRMLGGYIDCDYPKGGDSHDDHRNLGGSGDWNYNENENGCARWMIWAAYVDPNYSGQEYYEYFGDDPPGVLDCHSSDSDWELLGVYRQEFYQFIEQISKHLWAIDEYDYVVALAGLAYMTDYDCFQVGYDGDGGYIWAGVAPQMYGKFKMALYTDDYCLEPNENVGSFDDYGLTSDIQLSSGDKNEGGGDDDGGYGDEIQQWWTYAQEASLEMLNDVYEPYKYCTSCVDYPTYQDGYFIGDYGTDDDDLINQCWKFYSHDSFICAGDCISKGHAQGTMLSIEYGGTVFGKTLSDFSTAVSNAPTAESRWSRMLANAFVTFSFIVFVATFLAFAVARRSRHRERASGKSRRLLDDDERRRRKSEKDGLMRSKSAERSKSGKSRRSASRSRKSYEAPRDSRSKRSSSRSHKSSSKPSSSTRQDDF